MVLHNHFGPYHYPVTYAPIIGGVGFDMDSTVTRMDIFRDEMNLHSPEDNYVQKIMDAGIPYRNYHAVNSIAHSMYNACIQSINFITMCQW